MTWIGSRTQSVNLSSHLMSPHSISHLTVPLSLSFNTNLHTSRLACFWTTISQDPQSWIVLLLLAIWIKHICFCSVSSPSRTWQFCWSVTLSSNRSKPHFLPSYTPIALGPSSSTSLISDLGSFEISLSATSILALIRTWQFCRPNSRPSRWPITMTTPSYPFAMTQRNNGSRTRISRRV